MKIFYKVILLSILLVSTLLFSQKKYPSLLWEISGNGLKEKSYLYGTMHVSEKVAFNLSDDFYEKLFSVKQIALESDPELWLNEIYSKLNTDNFYQKNDYSYQSLYINNTSIDIYKQSLRAKDMLANGILYRRYPEMQNFQENTYIDMFIYRAAKKLNKKFVGLENIQESEDLVQKSEVSNGYINNSDIKNIKIKKLLKTKSLYELMFDAYRKQDLDLIDEISLATSTFNSRKYLLYIRNENMVKTMDSLMKKGSLFSAVGAAHLPGTYGIIEKLRNLGYTVQPITGLYTEKGRLKKEQLEHLVYNHKLKNYKSKTGLTIQSPEKFFNYSSSQDIDYLVSLDIPNGAFLSITKFNNYNFLKNNLSKVSLESIDSLLYENIPGKILNKKNISLDGFSGIELISKIEQDEYISMQIFVTPLQTYIVSLFGSKPYQDKYKSKIFKSLKLDNYTSTFSNFEPKYGGYTIKMPDYRVVTDTLYGHTNVIGYDNNTKSYYFMKSQVWENISSEKEIYELERIPYEIGKNLNAEIITTSINKENEIPYSESIIQWKNREKLYLKTMINSSYYHVAGIQTSNEDQKKDFFNSLIITDFKRLKKTEKFTNKTAGYSIIVPSESIKTKPKIDIEKSVNDSGDELDTSINIDDHEQNNTEEMNEGDVQEQTSFILDNGQTLSIFNYNYIPTSDSLSLDQVIKEYVDDQYPSDSCNHRKIKFLVHGITENKNSFSDYLLKEDTKAQAYRLRYFYENYRIYEIKYIVNAHKEFRNPSIEDIINNIQFLPFADDQVNVDNIENLDVNKEPTEITSTQLVDNDEFFKFNDEFSSSDVNSYSLEQDSLLWKPDIFIDKKILNQLKLFSNNSNKVEEFVLELNEQFLNQKLLEKVIKILDFHENTKPEFYLNLFTKFKNNGNAQFIILQKIIALDKDKQLNKDIIELIQRNQPIPLSESAIPNLMNNLELYDQSEDYMLPTLLSLLGVEEYQNTLIDYLTRLNDDHKLKAYHIKKYRDFFYKETDKEIKRILSYESGNSMNNPYLENNYSIIKLKKYLEILSIFNDTEYKHLIKSIRETKNIGLIELLISLKEPIDLTKEEYLFVKKQAIPSKKMNESYKEKFGEDLFNPAKDLTAELAKKELMKNILQNHTYDYEKVDSLAFKEEQNYSYEGKDYKIFYFTVYKNNIVSELDKNINAKEDEQDFHEYKEKDDNIQEVNIGIIAFDLMTSNKNNDTCYEENNQDGFTNESDYVWNSESDFMALTLFNSIDLYYKDLNEWEKLKDKFIDYLKSLSHPRSTSKFLDEVYTIEYPY
ncbi:TraB/GumN family protein [Apibacter muscae]|uniref:TraB/GumN family protein n=1 Tax=Apibacter muscae TaxID=2509004 RepID=UPI0011ABE208|nr:TraB/GumN family protein [Apibacter muscae]TWP27928.1 TraB/GumN family protein [Apibacter muscae]